MKTEKEVVKNFTDWTKIKIDIHLSEHGKDVYFKEGQIWWVSIGQNVDVEINGKNENFERPALVLKKFNERSLWILPVSSKKKTGRYYYQFKMCEDDGVNIVNFSQLRLISSKRLIRKMGTVVEGDFSKIKESVRGFI